VSAFPDKVLLRSVRVPVPFYFKNARFPLNSDKSRGSQRGYGVTG